MKSLTETLVVAAWFAGHVVAFAWMMILGITILGMVVQLCG